MPKHVYTVREIHFWVESSRNQVEQFLADFDYCPLCLGAIPTHNSFCAINNLTHATVGLENIMGKDSQHRD